MVAFVLIVGVIISVPIFNFALTRKNKCDNNNTAKPNRKPKRNLSRHDYDDNFYYIE